VRTFVALVAFVSLAGCRDAPKPVAVAATVTPEPGITIDSLAEYAAPDDGAKPRDAYYLITLTYTNLTDAPVEPHVEQFVYVDTKLRRYLAFDAGAPVVAGVSNARVTLERGQSHAYTIAFRVPRDAAGTLAYDPPR